MGSGNCHFLCSESGKNGVLPIKLVILYMKLLESSQKSNFDFDIPLRHRTGLELDISQQCAVVKRRQKLKGVTALLPSTTPF